MLGWPGGLSRAEHMEKCSGARGASPGGARASYATSFSTLAKGLRVNQDPKSASSCRFPVTVNLPCVELIEDAVDGDHQTTCQPLKRISLAVAASGSPDRRRHHTTPVSKPREQRVVGEGGADRRRT